MRRKDPQPLARFLVDEPVARIAKDGYGREARPRPVERRRRRVNPSIGPQELAIDARPHELVVGHDIRRRPRLAYRREVMIGRAWIELAILVVVEPGHLRRDVAVLVEDVHRVVDGVLAFERRGGARDETGYPFKNAGPKREIERRVVYVAYKAGEGRQLIHEGICEGSGDQGTGESGDELDEIGLTACAGLLIHPAEMPLD